MEKMKKAKSKMWSILYALPLILFLIGFFTFTFRQSNVSLDYINIENYFTSLSESEQLAIFKNLFGSYLPNFLNLITSNESVNVYVDVIAIFVNYYVVMSLLHLVIDVILFIPNVVKKVLKKAGVKDVE